MCSLSRTKLFLLKVQGQVYLCYSSSTASACVYGTRKVKQTCLLILIIVSLEVFVLSCFYRFEFVILSHSRQFAPDTVLDKSHHTNYGDKMMLLYSLSHQAFQGHDSCSKISVNGLFNEITMY